MSTVHFWNGDSSIRDTIGVTPASWLTSLRSYFSSINAAIHLDVTGFPPLEREHDGFIMGWIVQSHQYTDKEVVRLNNYQLLNAVTQSDLTATNGRHLDPGKLEGAPSIMSAQSRWMAVHQDRPSAKEWQ
jgi:hypothetical protein